MLWMDIDEKATFGHLESKIISPSSRKCALGQVKFVSECQTLPSDFHSQSNFIIEPEELKDGIKKDPENESSWEKLDKMDEVRTQCMSAVENKC